MYPGTICRAPRLSVALALSVVLLCAGCDGAEEPVATTPAAPAGVPEPASAQPIVLEDVIEAAPTHIVGISFPDGLERYPGLAAQAQRFAEEARREVVDAATDRRPGDATGPYELSLEFRLHHESPQMVVLAVDGSSYTGGAHGLPVVGRWVWLPPENRLLTVADLFPREDSWETIATDVRRELRDELGKQLDSAGVSAAQRAEAMREAAAMIDGGTEPGPESFAVYEPVVGPDGRIDALRFLFPPYQVGPYAEGMRTVELPAAELVRLVDPRYRPLFGTA